MIWHGIPPPPGPDPQLQSGISVPPGEKPLSDAIRQTLAAPPQARAALFERLVREIELLVAALPDGRPWTCTVYTGTDGSHIFRGGVGHSLVIDPAGRLWRARSYEDFLTTYTLTPTTCVIASLTPLYAQMREYLPQTDAISTQGPSSPPPGSPPPVRRGNATDPASPWARGRR